jgi:hypothetical protein
VIVYLTTGKVFIQGKEGQHFCDNYFEPCLRFTENLENQDQTLIKEGTSVNVDNNIEPETIETREISEIKNNSGRKLKVLSRMNNPDTLATLGTDDTGRKQTNK